MIKHGKGGANTNKNGLRFEQKTDLENIINKQQDYKVVDGKVYYKDSFVAEVFKKHKLYDFLGRYGVDWKERISRKLLPDNCLFVPRKRTIFIFESKYQETDGSTDEKLQTCDFKLRQYKKLFKGTHIKVKFLYVLSDYYKKDIYKDVLEYIQFRKCEYYYEYVNLDDLYLP